MTGRIWIFAEKFHELNDEGELDRSYHIDYVEHDYPKEKNHEDRGWFFSKWDCEKNIEYQQDYMKKNLSSLSCVDRCFCGLYRIQLKKYFKKGNYKRSWLLLIAGFHRMLKDHVIFIYYIVKVIEKLFNYTYRGLLWGAQVAKKENSKC